MLVSVWVTFHQNIGHQHHRRGKIHFWLLPVGVACLPLAFAIGSFHSIQSPHLEWCRPHWRVIPRLTVSGNTSQICQESLSQVDPNRLAMMDHHSHCSHGKWLPQYKTGTQAQASPLMWVGWQEWAYKYTCMQFSCLCKLWLHLNFLSVLIVCLFPHIWNSFGELDFTAGCWLFMHWRVGTGRAAGALSFVQYRS